jgi:hypothetical protein
MLNPVHLLQSIFQSIEFKQEASGKGLQAQKLRLMQVRRPFNTCRCFLEWMVSQIEADVGLQETVQREVFLSEQYQQAQGTAKEDGDQLQQWLMELNGLNEAY